MASEIPGKLWRYGYPVGNENNAAELMETPEVI